ncbi:MAG TPA: hypothetical protein VKE40_01220 [Gemmataceae bacterium]|nr:hypothetical protein [Gemmataceae bacterium]
MWYRVFCRSADEVPPAAILGKLRDEALPVEGRFRRDDLGWTAGELAIGKGAPVYLERYLATADSIRDDLNTWAAWLETLDYSPNNTSLMELVIQTQQLVIIRKPLDHSNEVEVDRVCRAVCLFIAASADGVFQVEDDGWYAADGGLILKEY